MLDAIVIGAGYAGMGTAALLARAGWKVLVIEKTSLVGGRASSFTDDQGYTWEFGAHSFRLGHKGIANELFHRLGLEINFLPETRDAKLIYSSRLWERPNGALGFLTTPMLSLRARLTLLMLLVRIKKASPGMWYDRTLLDFYHQWFSNQELEGFLSFLGMTVMCPDPGRVSAGEVISFIQRALAAGIGAGDAVGGTRQICAKLQTQVEKTGELHLNEEVLSLRTDHGRVIGVETDKGTYDSQRIVYAAPLDHLFDIANEELFSPEFCAYCRSIEHSSGLTIDFVTDYPVCDIKGGILGVDVPIWARFQSNADPSFTPQGRYLSTWGILLPWGFDGDPEIVEKTEARLKSTISTLFPHFLANLRRERKLVVNRLNGNVLVPLHAKPHRPDVRCDAI
ncbi:MAG: FAD-dependent oxidoreductase, partial [Desulfomonilia bacterium]|nr:FAD-dependent oxidoreductase [Desulfomonilia bacterium]